MKPPPNRTVACPGHYAGFTDISSKLGSSPAGYGHLMNGRNFTIGEALRGKENYFGANNFKEPVIRLTYPITI
jgi:hypothetical protein